MNTGSGHTADYKSLSVLTMAMIFGVVLFGLISLALHYFSAVSDKSVTDSQTVFGVVLLIGSLVIIATRLIYARRIAVLKAANQSSREKLDIFRSITITHMALCEFTALLSIICFIVFGYFLFFLVVFIALVEMFMKYPTQHRIESTINSGTF